MPFPLSFSKVAKIAGTFRRVTLTAAFTVLAVGCYHDLDSVPLPKPDAHLAADAGPDAPLPDTRPDAPVPDTTPDAPVPDTRPDAPVPDTRPDAPLPDSAPDAPQAPDSGPDAPLPVDSGPDATKCGNGAVDPGETCDTKYVGGETCITKGMAGGTLGCSSDCMAYDFSACTWFAVAPGNGYETAIAIDGDKLGNAYVSGVFGHGLYTPPCSATFGSTTLKSVSGADIFVAKLGTKGKFLWATAMAGTGTHDAPYDIATDDSGTSYVSGMYQKTMTFRSGSKAIVYSSKGGVSKWGGDIFLAKVQPSGYVDEVLVAGGTGSEGGRGVALDNTGSVWATANLTSAFSIDTTAVSPASGADVTVKLDSNLNVKKVVQGGFSGYWGDMVAVQQNNLCFSGSYTLACSVVGPGAKKLSLAQATCGSKACDATNFVAMYDTTKGHVVWAKALGGSNNYYASRVATDGSACYVVGQFAGKLALELKDKSKLSLTSKGEIDMLVLKLDASGQILWANQAGGVNDDVGLGIALDGSKNVYVTGKFFSPALTSLDNKISLAGVGPLTSRVIVAKLDPAGTFKWAATSSGKGHNSEGNGIHVDHSGNSWIAGGFGGSAATFGPVTKTPSGFGLFVWKLGTNGP